ncbi:MAG: DEAD/DEAH box helicase [Pseudomonadota bacterium]
MAEPITRAIAEEGYTSPTPIQADVIPAMLDDRDILGIAQTGTGKTASFVLPILQRLAKSDGARRPKHSAALILAPTRELAQQIADNAQAYSQFMAVSVTVIVGGVKPGRQIKALARGVDIIVATPGRLLDHTESGALSLTDTKMVVLDEADQMLDLGFVPAIRRIMGKLPKKRQTVMMSATMPKQIRKLAADFQSNPKEIAVAAVSRPIERIEQAVMHLPMAQKKDALAAYLAPIKDRRAIVFTRTKRGADRVSKHLDAWGITSAAIHGNKSQPQRQKALDAFKTGQTSVLVATDIAARGIDIDDVSHVVNYELPNVSESYVHRIGRTARAGRAGVALSLCDREERKLLKDIEKLIGNSIKVVSAPSGVQIPVVASSMPAKAQPPKQAKGQKLKKQSRGRAEPETASQPAQKVRTKNSRPGRFDKDEKPAQAAKPQAARTSTASKPKGKSGPGGTVKWFSSHKGYGFISPNDGSADIFVHSSAVELAGIKKLKEGDRLTYKLETAGARGKPTAVDLRPQ